MIAVLAGLAILRRGALLAELAGGAGLAGRSAVGIKKRFRKLPKCHALLEP